MSSLGWLHLLWPLAASVMGVGAQGTVGGRKTSTVYKGAVNGTEAVQGVEQYWGSWPPGTSFCLPSQLQTGILLHTSRDKCYRGLVNKMTNWNKLLNYQTSEARGPQRQKRCRQYDGAVVTVRIWSCRSLTPKRRTYTRTTGHDLTSGSAIPCRTLSYFLLSSFWGTGL